MNNKKNRKRALKILENALEEIKELGIDYTFVSSIFCFDRNGNATDETRWYCERQNVGNGIDGIEYKMQAEALVEAINVTINEIKYASDEGRRYKMRFIQHASNIQNNLS